MKILIKNVDIITCDNHKKIIKNAYLAIENGYITYIGNDEKRILNLTGLLTGKTKF